MKPAAVTPATLALVEKTFKSYGIKVTGSGTLDAKTIDSEQLIDTHYGAIASKAVKLQPSELNVSPKAKAAFEKTVNRMHFSFYAGLDVYPYKNNATYANNPLPTT